MQLQGPWKVLGKSLSFNTKI